MATGTTKAPSKKAPATKAPKAKAPAEPVTDAAAAATPVAAPAKKGGADIALIALKDISVAKGLNPRTTVGDIEHLSASIKAEGLLSSLVIAPAAPSDKVKTPYIVVAGERRFSALTALSAPDPVPCIVRADLAGDRDRQRAVAIAENSADGRVNLNAIEVGRVVSDLAAKGWTPAKIAKETALHQQSVRRALKLMEAPEDVQSKVASGEISMTSALEVAKMPESARKAVVAELGKGISPSVSDVKAMRKKAEKEAAAEAGTAPVKTTAKGDVSKRQPTAWRSSTVKQAELRKLCSILHPTGDGATPLTDEEKSTADYFELRGAVAALLWDRGDLDTALLPPAEGATAAEKKTLVAFEKLIEAESKNYVPPKGRDED